MLFLGSYFFIRRDYGMKDILLVDDKLWYAPELAGSLEFYNRRFNVFTVDSGKKAGEMLRAFIIDVVVVNLAMSDADVFALIGYVKGKFPRVKIVALRPDGKQGLDGLVRNMEVDHYLEDPLDFMRVADKILTA
jgi:DNA-binding NtrC family response regulator